MMNVKLVVAGIVSSLSIFSYALDSVEVTDVKARQRYPWNGIVDIDFKLDSIPTEPYRMKVEVYDNVGKTNLTVKSAWTEGVSYKDNPCMVRTDTRRILWDAAADLPNGFKCTNVLVTCRDERLEDDPKRYMIIDLSAGSTATTYPVSYTNCPPPGGWTEEYKTTKLVLRKVNPTRFHMGSPVSDSEREDDESYHEVELTKAFYLGVFKVTTAQYAQICGGTSGDIVYVQKTWNEWRGWDVGNDEYFGSTISAPDASWYDARYITSSYIRSCQKKVATDYCWPNTVMVSPGSFIGKLRDRTNMSFDMPTEAQWECASRSGSVTVLNIGESNSVLSAGLIRGQNYRDSNDGIHKDFVGNYLPNAGGFFDMNNGCGEWCLDVYSSNLGNDYVCDPKGAPVSYKSITLSLGTYKPEFRSKVQYGSDSYYFDYIAQSALPVQFVGQSIPRTVRCVSERIADRDYSLTLNNTGFTYQTGIWCQAISYQAAKYCKANYTNPSYGVRLALIIE